MTRDDRKAALTEVHQLLHEEYHEMTRYYCKHCNQFVRRPTKQAWVNSFCSAIGRVVRLVRK